MNQESKAVQALNDRPQDEQEAIAKFYAVSHHSNLPKNADTVKWFFEVNGNQLDASYMAGYAF